MCCPGVNYCTDIHITIVSFDTSKTSIISFYYLFLSWGFFCYSAEFKVNRCLIYGYSKCAILQFLQNELFCLCKIKIFRDMQGTSMIGPIPSSISMLRNLTELYFLLLLLHFFFLLKS